MPARRKLPTIICNLPSHRNTQRQQHGRNVAFRHAKHRNSTELSKHIWTLKDNDIEHFISWRILSSHSPYNSSSKRCNLCLKKNSLSSANPSYQHLTNVMNSYHLAATETKPSYETTNPLNFTLHILCKLYCI